MTIETAGRERNLPWHQERKKARERSGIDVIGAAILFTRRPVRQKKRLAFVPSAPSCTIRVTWFRYQSRARPFVWRSFDTSSPKACAGLVTYSSSTRERQN